jgi:hypothetical protein
VSKATVSIEEPVLTQSYELAALFNLLERKGVLTQGEVLEDNKRRREMDTLLHAEADRRSERAAPSGSGCRRKQWAACHSPPLA